MLSESALKDALKHLNEVIEATEAASHAIMGAAETIQEITAGMGGDRELRIREAAGHIFESCSFQDIAGQHIRIVMNMLSEKQAHAGKTAEEKSLLAGPQMAGQGVSQADVDALLGNSASKANK